MKKMPEVDGLKTGYYREAGFSIVATAKRNNTRLLAAVLGSTKKSVRTQITFRLLQKGFNQYRLIKVLEKGSKLGGPVTIKNGQQEKVDLQVEEDVELFLKLADVKRIKHRFILPDSISAPVMAGKVIGTVELQIQDQTLKKVNLLSAQSVEVKTFWEKVQEIFKF